MFFVDHFKHGIGDLPAENIGSVAGCKPNDQLILFGKIGFLVYPGQFKG
jgi:hypothetical protein